MLKKYPRNQKNNCPYTTPFYQSDGKLKLFFNKQ